MPGRSCQGIPIAFLAPFKKPHRYISSQRAAEEEKDESSSDDDESSSCEEEEGSSSEEESGSSEEESSSESDSNFDEIIAGEKREKVPQKEYNQGT